MRLFLTAIGGTRYMAACAHITPEQQIAANQQVSCSGSTDCELKWARATKWLQDNSHWKLRTVTESILTTEGPNSEAFPTYEAMREKATQRLEALLRVGHQRLA